MHPRRILRTILLFVAFPAAFLPAARALQVHNRLLQAISVDDSTQRATIANTVPPAAARAQDLGPASPDQALSSITLRFNLSPAQNSALNQLLADQQNPHSPRYRQWLTPEQFGAGFGLSAADLAQVSAWARAQGLTVTEVARSRTFVILSGSVAQVQRAFGVSLHRFALDGEQHIANVNDPTLPVSLAGVVGTVTGLHDFRLKPHVRPRFTSSISGSHFIAPGDFYTIYDLNPLLTNAINGAGRTIAVMGQTDISLADVAAFRTASGLPANAPTIMLYGADPGQPTAGDVDEAQLDVEWSGAVAPGASILYVNSKDVFGSSLVQAVNNNVAPIITISYGDCEVNIGTSNLAAYNQLFLQANAQGQTIVGPTGDSGATDCDYQVASAAGGLAVDFPSSSPHVTAVGGTMFNEGSGTYFNSTNGTFAGSALSYIPEAVWNESSSAGLASGGGGVSTYFPKPTYQQGLGVPADGLRDVPDISFNAASGHDGYLFCSRGFCTNGFRNASSNLDVVGGTSVSTPAFAGILALVEQKIAANIGNANPVLYALANSTYSSAVFHDITTGNNNSPCTAGTVGCPSGGSIGYSAGTGYDLATGWGSTDAFNLVNDWKLVTPLGVTTGQNASVTTLASSAAGGNAGVTLTLTATVTSGVAGVTATPTGMVQFSVDSVAAGAAVSLAGGTATYALNTSALNSGAHVVTAAYLGDATYAGSTASYTINITSATSGDYTVVPSATTVNVASGSTSSPVTLTVGSLNGFTGSVLFGVASNLSGNLSLALTVNPVTLTANGTATTVLTFNAFRSLATSTTGGLLSEKTRLPLRFGAAGLTLACLVMLSLPGRRKRLPVLLAGLVSAGLIGTVGCSSNAAAPVTQIKATPGTYVVTLTASGTGVPTHTVTVNFIVQ